MSAHRRRRPKNETGYLRKSLGGPKSPETTPKAPKFPENPAMPRNAPKIPTEFILSAVLNSPEFSQNFSDFPKLAQIPPNPLKFPGNQGRRGIHAISQVKHSGDSQSRTAKLRTWMLQIWCFEGSGSHFALYMLCGERSHADYVLYCSYLVLCSELTVGVPEIPGTNNSKSSATKTHRLTPPPSWSKGRMNVVCSSRLQR